MKTWSYGFNRSIKKVNKAYIERQTKNLGYTVDLDFPISSEVFENNFQVITFRVK